MSLTLLLLNPDGETVTPTLQGTPIPNTTVGANLGGQNYVREMLDANVLSLTARIEYSLDGGQTWSELCQSGVIHASHSSFSRWFHIPQAAKTECQLRAVAVGLVSATIRYVEIEAR